MNSNSWFYSPTYEFIIVVFIILKIKIKSNRSIFYFRENWKSEVFKRNSLFQKGHLKKMTLVDC